MQLTEEQQNIINSEESNILVKAKAGTGKTTTLLNFTKNKPLNSFLYLAYNSSIRKEALKKFFGNTTVHTIHSLAYEEIGYLFKDKLQQKELNLKNIINGVDSLKKLYLEDSNNQEVYIEANHILNLLLFYFSSKELFLENIESAYQEKANEYWLKMQSIKNDDVKMTHDGYLKLYQMSAPTLNYNYILVDEAQDSNEVMLDIILKQKSKKIFVGDKDQELYGFRNAFNVFKNKAFKDYKKFSLTKSFRFGESVSYVANFLLNHYKQDVEDKIIGLNKDDIVFDLKNEKTTIITRTNAYLFDLAIFYMKQNKRIHIIGENNEIFKELKDCYYLYSGEKYKIKNLYIKQFGNFNKFKEVAKKTMDMDLIFLIKIIEKYKDSILDYIKQLSFQLVSKESFAEITLTTTHKAKGLEFFNVKLGEDFYPLFTKNGHLKNRDLIPYEEINIYYVAITRTIEKIQLNNDIIKLISN